MTPPVKQKVNVHVLPIRVSFLNTGLYVGSLNPEFLKELGTLMSKWNIMHLEAVLVPCLRDQKIEVTVKEEEAADSHDDAYGP